MDRAARRRRARGCGAGAPRYAERLNAALGTGFRPSGETYEVTLAPAAAASDEEGRRALAAEVEAHRRRARAAPAAASPGRTATRCRSSSTDATPPRAPRRARCAASSSRWPSPTLRVYREETGRSAVALLDDLDSELDEERAVELCAEVTRRGQALVTSAHAGWAESLRPLGRIYNVAEGRVACA